MGVVSFGFQSVAVGRCFGARVVGFLDLSGGGNTDMEGVNGVRI